MAETNYAGQPAEPGTTVTVEWGNEHYSPFPYHGVDTGVLRVTAPVRPGESVAAATVRVWNELAAAARPIRNEKIHEYLKTAGRVKAHVNTQPAPAAGSPR